MWLHFLIKLSCHLLRPFVILKFPAVQPLPNHIGDQKECHCGYFRPNFVVILRRGEVTSLTSYLRQGGGGGALKGRRGDRSKFEQLFSLIPLTENNRLDFF